MVIDMREMKESGITGIGQIPVTYMTSRIKYIADIYGRIGFRGYTQQDLVGEGEGPITLSPSNLKDMRMDFDKCSYLTWEKYYESPEIMINKGDILFVKTGSSYGKNCYVSELPMECTINPQLVVFKNIKVDEKWFAYFLQTKHIENLSKLSVVGGTIPTMSQVQIGNFSIVIPPLSEQKAIVAFLDSKCAEIDALSADIQSEIDTLEAYKRSKVFDTVTHGIDHTDFVQTDSDVWSTIPTGWKLVDIKYIFEIVKRIAGKEGFDVIAITQQGLKYKDITSNGGQLASDYSGYQFVYPGDYAMNHMDLLTGWVDLSDKFGVTSPDYRVFRLRYPDAYDHKYYKYIMQCCYMNRIFYSLGQGVSNLGRWRLQTSAFNNFKVPVPPYEKQVKIGEYLDAEISEINGIISQKQEQLAVLTDYKKSVIYEYVTGKKEVPVA